MNKKNYTIRKTKNKKIMIISFYDVFFKKISNLDGWVIRLTISKILNDIKKIKGDVVIDFDSEKKINEIININGETFFDEEKYLISNFYINGLLNGGILDIDYLINLNKNFFEMLKSN